jgi:hypothetical protein
MSAQLKLMDLRHLSQQVVDIAPQQVFRYSAFHAKQVVVVPAVAQLIVQVAIL